MEQFSGRNQRNVIQLRIVNFEIFELLTYTKTRIEHCNTENMQTETHELKHESG